MKIVALIDKEEFLPQAKGALLLAIAECGGTQESLAQAVGVTQSHVSYWMSKGVPLDRAMQIEFATSQKITRQQLCPYYFQQASNQ